ncbi:MAG: phage major tail tube protein [Desulfovibrio sp.]
MSILQMGISFALGAGLGTSFEKAIKHASTSVKQLGQQITKVEKSGNFKLGKGLEVLSKKTRDANREFRAAGKRLADLKDEAKASGGESKNLARRIEMATIGGEEALQIDPINSKYVVNGTDYLASVRRNIGMEG